MKKFKNYNPKRKIFNYLTLIFITAQAQDSFLYMVNNDSNSLTKCKISNSIGVAFDSYQVLNLG
jgi:hypothetical protein